MAIYHFKSKIISRANGKNAVSSAAYRHACVMKDDILNQTFDHSKKSYVMHSEILIPETTSNWANELRVKIEEDVHGASELLWNQVEQTEKRKDSQLAREIEFALPMELTLEQNIVLAREFIVNQLVVHGMVADWNVHNDPGKPHMHVMLTLRALTDDGFGLKIREWNSKMLLMHWREKWAEIANYHLQQHGHDVRIDHRSYKDQGLELIPIPHQSLAVIQMNDRGIKTQKMEEVNLARAENLRRIAASPKILLEKIERESTTFTSDKLVQEVSRYLPHPVGNSSSVNPVLSKLLFENLTAQESASIPSPVLSVDDQKNIFTEIEHFEAVFGERELAKAVMAYTDQADLFARAVMELKASPEIISLGTGDDGRMRYTTGRMFALENRVQQIADSLHNQKTLKISKHVIHKALAQHERLIEKILTPEQRAAVLHMVKPQGLSCVVGRAGTGKSFTLGAAKAIWEAQGLYVHGIALSGIAADGLQKETGIKSATIASFLAELKTGRRRLHSRSVVVMDEAGMTDADSMLAVLEKVIDAKAKLVLVGDPAQIQPVGPGAIFRALLERTGFCELQTVYRQKHAWQREATVAFSTGRVDEALNAYDAKGMIHFEKDSHTAMNRLVADWLSLRQENASLIDQTVVIAHRNEDVIALNTKLRTALIAQGELADGYAVNAKQGEIWIAKSDRLLFLKNDRELNISNGRFATVKEVKFTETGKVMDFIVVPDGTDQSITINPECYNDFTYGYAATVHKVQGMTVDHSFVYAGGYSWNRCLTYVAMSRHRESCRLYAGQDAYQDIAALKRGLSRYALKDSLLDFPLAFAERRGIDSEQQHATWSKRLSKRLNEIKEQLIDRSQQLFNPNKYWQEKEAALQHHIQTEQTELARQDAKDVAAYVDANRAVGSGWSALQDRLQRLGFDKISYAADDIALISKTTEYQALQTASIERDRFAFKILQMPDRYEKAICIYGLDLNKLAKQAYRHGLRQDVKRYLDFERVGKMRWRDKTACDLMQNILVYYPLIKERSIDSATLRKQALEHKKRELFAHLTPDEQAAFALVACYQELSQAMGQWFSTQPSLEKHPNAIHQREAIEDMENISREREALAGRILAQREICDAALTFYQMGIAQPVLSNNAPTTELIKAAEARWYKLQQAAARHDVRDVVQHYHTALLNNDGDSRQRLAHQIMQDHKAYHGAVVNTAGMPAALWRSIRADAKQYARNQLWASLTRDEQTHFALVEDYVQERRQSGEVWSEILTSKKDSGLSDEEFQKKLVPFADTPTQARDRLALAITLNPEPYQAGLDFYEIKPETLNKPAYREQCRQAIRFYQVESDVLTRARMAQVICNDPKAHHGAILAANMSWRDIYRHARIAERVDQFAELSVDDKRLRRLLERYKRINRQTGKAWSKVFAAKDRKETVPEKHLNVANYLGSKRDYLAHQLMEQKAVIEYGSLVNGRDLTQFYKDDQSNWEKINTHASRHQEKLEVVERWQSANQMLKDNLSYVLSSNENEPINIDAYHHCQMLQCDAASFSGPMQKNLKAYTFALQAIDSSIDKFKTGEQQKTVVFSALHQLEQKTLAAMDHEINKIDADQLRRISRAREIEQGTRPIAGTLAEKYLREHRGIQGQLAESLRYHPGVYHFEAKRKLPALVAVAKNTQGETQAVQAIFLDGNTCQKAKLAAPKLTYGVLSQDKMGVLINAGKDSQKIAIAEGVETALSVLEANPELRVYAVLGSSNFARAPVAKDTHQVLFCADNDGKRSASQKKLKQVAEKLAKQGIEVWQAYPEQEKTDFNDLLKAQGKAAVRERLDQAELLFKGQSTQQLLAEVSESIRSMNGEEKPVLALQESILEYSVQQNHPQKLEEQSPISETFTSEEVASYRDILKTYKELKTTYEHDEGQTEHDMALCQHAYNITRQSGLMSYLTTTYPKMKQNIEMLADLQARRLDDNRQTYTPEQEQSYTGILKKYKELKQTYEQDTNKYPVFREMLEQYAQQMSQSAELMRYVNARYPKIAKNIQTLSRSYQLERSLDIDR